MAFLDSQQQQTRAEGRHDQLEELQIVDCGVIVVERDDEDHQAEESSQALKDANGQSGLLQTYGEMAATRQFPHFFFRLSFLTMMNYRVKVRNGKWAARVSFMGAFWVEILSIGRKVKGHD